MSSIFDSRRRLPSVFPREGIATSVVIAQGIAYAVIGQRYVIELLQQVSPGRTVISHKKSILKPRDTHQFHSRYRRHRFREDKT